MPKSKLESLEDLRRNVLSDIADRQTWASKQDEIARRRLSARPTNKTKPYVGAPNFVEPIIDDNVREKTDQEISMLLNAPVMAHAMPLRAKLSAKDRNALEHGFDTYLRNVIEIRPIIEEGIDTKNERGFTVFEVIRSKNNRLNIDLPVPAVRDPKDVIVPTDTQHPQDAERITRVIRLSPLGLRTEVAKNEWNEDAAKEIIRRIKSGGRSDNGSEEEPIHEVTADLVGIATSETENSSDGQRSIKEIVIWQVYHYADKDDFARDDELIEDRRMVTVFCPDVTDVVIAEFPWREKDEQIAMPEGFKLDEVINARGEGREPNFAISTPGKDKPWPIAQPRHESRANFWYDSRGLGELLMDNQIKATQMQNAKAVLTDFYAAPMYSGDVRNSGNMSFRPGSRVPSNFSWVTPPQISPQFDFDVNQERMTAGKRAGAQGQNLFSGDVGRQKVEKTAAEVNTESARINMVSSASVDRFNTPMGQLFQLIWEDLKRIRPTLPILVNNEFEGEMDPSLFDLEILWLPASSSKTLNPELQLQRSVGMANFAMSLAPSGLAVNPESIFNTVSSYWDSQLTSDWVVNPQEAGPQGQPPVFQAIQGIQQQMQQISQVLQEFGQNLQASLKLSDENSNRLDRQEQKLEAMEEKLSKQLQSLQDQIRSQKRVATVQDS